MNGLIADYTQMFATIIKDELDAGIERAAKERVDAKQTEIDQLKHELNTARYEAKYFKSDRDYALGEMNFHKKVREAQAHIIHKLHVENQRLKNPWWVRVFNRIFDWVYL